MKNFTFILITLTTLVTTVKGQHLIVSPMMEKTVAGTQYGAQLIVETRTKWSLGAFYQKSLQPSEGSKTYYPFYGATLNAPIMKSKKINFLFNLRAGLVNDYFFVIAPGFETNLVVSRVISVSLLTSVRMESSSTALKINVKI